MTFWRARYRLRRRQGASRTAAALDAVFWAGRDTPYLSQRLGLRAWR